MQGYTSAELIKRGISQIFIGDKKRLDEVLGGQGWRYIAGAILIFPLTLIKVVDFFIRNKHLTYHAKPIVESGIGLSTESMKKAREVHFLEQLEDYDRIYLPNPTPQQSAKESALQALRIRFEADLKFGGKLLSANGTEQRVTFGNTFNAELKTIFPALKLMKLKSSEQTYFVFEKDEVLQLEAKLRNTFMKPVTIMLKREK